MFEDIKKYILLDKEARQLHLDLTQECIEIGGSSKEFRALLAHHIKTTIPSGRSIFLCHACHNDKCSNVKHLYWGTHSENNQDTDSVLGSLAERTIKIHGADFFSKNAKNRGSLGGKANAGKPKSEEHKRKISEALRK
jgi:hypothetical protein